jgi:ribonuclease D
MAAWKAEVEEAQSKDRWRRVSGISGLDARTLAIVRELFLWRESEADRRNKPVRRVLRDDLIVEIARRQTADAKHILGIRGLDRGDLRRHVPQIAACVERGLAMPEQDCPDHIRGEQTTKMSVLGQFLFAALGSICREARLAPNLVGGPNDIRDLILYRLSEGTRDRRPPKLARGWRAEFVGRLFDDLLAGNKAIRIGDPASDHPLVFETRSPDAG